MSPRLSSGPYRFKRSPGMDVFFPHQPVSKDVLHALEWWCDSNANRRYSILDGEDAKDFLVIQLEVEEQDSEAGHHLYGSALLHGVSYEPV